MGSIWRRAAGIVSVTILAASVAGAQGRDRGRNDGGRDDRGRVERGREDRGDRGRDERGRDAGRHEWTRSSEGRRFENGIVLREGTRFQDRRWDRYFPNRYYSYPYYAESRGPSIDVVISPYSFYLGIFPRYIHRDHVFIAPPPHVWISVPIILGERRTDDYYLHRQPPDDNRWKNDTQLKNAVYDFEDAFRNSDITLLARLTDPSAKVAVFTNGKYDYSLEANDYLDMTRDFLRVAHTTDFNVYRVHERARDVYQLFARHTYRDAEDRAHTVYLCAVMELIHGQWTLTQVESSSSRID